MFHLQEADIGCVYVSSGMDWTEQRSSFDRVRTCSSQDTIVLFVTPEKVGSWLEVTTFCAGIFMYHHNACWRACLRGAGSMPRPALERSRWQPAMR